MAVNSMLHFQYENLYFNTYHQAAVNEPGAIYTPKQLLREREIFYKSLQLFFTLPQFPYLHGLCPPPDPLKWSVT